jgi:hypothetical protein
MTRWPTRLCLLSVALLFGSTAWPQELCTSPAYGLTLPPSAFGGDGVELLANGAAGGGQMRVLRRVDGVWSQLPGLFSGDVLALASSSGGPLAAGNFTALGGQPVNRVARFDGSQWQSLGGGIDSPGAVVRAVIEHQGQVFAAGNFSSAGGVPCNNIARFDGSSWHPLGAGVDGTVRALASFQGVLVVAGAFAQADGQPIANVAAFDGNTFLPLGGVALPPVFDLAQSDDQLLAAAGSVYSCPAEGFPAGDWQVFGTPDVDQVAAIRVEIVGGRFFAAGPWNNPTCLSTTLACLAVAEFEHGAWEVFHFDNGTPILASLSLGRSDSTLFVSGGSIQFLPGGNIVAEQISTAPVVTSVNPFSVPWYKQNSLQLKVSCQVTGAPATLRIGTGAPLPVTFTSGEQAQVVIPAGYLLETGALDLRFEQAGQVQLLAGELDVRPVLTTNLTTDAAGYVFAGLVHYNQLGGHAWLLTGTPSALPVTVSELGGQLVLDPSSGLLVLGSAVLTHIPPTVQPTFTFAYPFAALPPGTTLPLQAVALELAIGGPFVAFTNGVVAELTF